MRSILDAEYVPFEQLNSRGKKGPWTDVYSLAAIIYRAATGQVPPNCVDRLEEDEIQPPAKLGVKMPAVSERALMKALAMPIGERYQSMEEFKHALLGEEKNT